MKTSRILFTIDGPKSETRYYRFTLSGFELHIVAVDLIRWHEVY
jgi:hypothetical protein